MQACKRHKIIVKENKARSCHIKGHTQHKGDFPAEGGKRLLAVKAADLIAAGITKRTFHHGKCAVFAFVMNAHQQYLVALHRHYAAQMKHDIKN